MIRNNGWLTRKSNNEGGVMKREVLVTRQMPHVVQEKIQDKLNKGWKPVLASVATTGSLTLSLVFFEKDDEKEV